MDWSWLERLAPELVIFIVIGLVIYALIQRAEPLLKAAVQGINATVESYESVSKQQADLFDRLDKLNQREIANLQKEVDEEKAARTKMEDKLFTAQQDLGALRIELDIAKRELLEEKDSRIHISKERDELAAKVKTLEGQVAELQSRLDKVNHVKERKSKALKTAAAET